ncbi:MAG: anaerobic ribonucleoside-triphosphate reductase activating protein [Candidatus Gribaldobacteria bacterium]|nr:anaerobic ribonucleoside-triphosphate reductase activating protein [Candidatus Gribaldobacteria bacterium]
MQLAGLQKFTLVEGLPQPACVVFSAGCNYQCPWCNHTNRLDSVKSKLSEKYFWQFLQQQQGKLKTCVVSGGEPTIQEDLPRFLQKIKKLGYRVRLDTNGSNPDLLASLIKDNLVDLVSLDIKSPKGKYGYLIGFAEESMHYLLEKINQSLMLLKNSRLNYEIKTTIGTFLTPQDVWQIVHWIRPAKKYVLVNFRSQGISQNSFQIFEPYSDEKLVSLKEKIAPFFDTCEIRESMFVPHNF